MAILEALLAVFEVLSSIFEYGVEYMNVMANILMYIVANLAICCQ